MTSSFSQPVICPVLVGRDDALASLRVLLEQSDERGRVALVSGEAGIGKSKLLAQFLIEMESAGRRVRLVRFFEQDLGLPYSGIVRLLADLASDPDAMAAVAANAADLGLVSPEAARLLTDNASLAPEGENEKLRFLQALASTVHALCSAQPIVLAFEDVHWADASSLEALLYLAHKNAPQRLMVLTYRHDEVGPELSSVLTELDRERVSAEVRLGGLGVAHVDAMLKACLATETSTRADVLHSIYQLTSGNPFFVEEVTRALLDRAEGVQGLNTLRLADFDMPRGLNETVRRRTSGLTPATREVLSLAAVAGVKFDFPLLQQVAGREPGELLGVIKELVAAQLVVEESEDNFAFRHALTREAIRSELLRRERRQLSLKIAQAIEKLHTGEEEGRAEDLSLHFYDAGEWPKAFDYSIRAGRRAMTLYAAAAALTHLTRALQAGEHLDGTDLSEALRLRGTAYEAIGDFEAARADYENAASEAWSDARTRWRALLNLGLLWAARDYSRSEPYLRQALELARELDDPRALAESLGRLGNWYLNTGDVESAQTMSEEALGIFRSQGDQVGVARTLDLLGITCTLGMRFEQAASYYREAIGRLEALNDRRTLTSALAAIQIGSGSAQTDMMPPALTLKEGSDFGERALAIAREMGWKADESFALWQLAFTTAPQGQLSIALAYAREALAIAKSIGHTQWEAGSECAVASILTDLMATSEAKTHLLRAVELGQEMKSQLWSMQAEGMLVDAMLAAREPAVALERFDSVGQQTMQGFGPLELFTAGADAALATGQVDRALDMLERLEEYAGRVDSDKPVLRLVRMRARALVATGRLDDGIALLEAARTAARDQCNVSYEWRLAAELAHAQLAAGDRDAARFAANEALEQIDAVALSIDDEDMRRSFLAKAGELLPAALRRRSNALARDALTAREHEIATLIAEGLTSREIAGRLVLSSRTVESHVANAMAKLAFTSRSQLAAWAAEHRSPT